MIVISVVARSGSVIKIPPVIQKMELRGPDSRRTHGVGITPNRNWFGVFQAGQRWRFPEADGFPLGRGEVIIALKTSHPGIRAVVNRVLKKTCRRFRRRNEHEKEAAEENCDAHHGKMDF